KLSGSLPVGLPRALRRAARDAGTGGERRRRIESSDQIAGPLTVTSRPPGKCVRYTGQRGIPRMLQKRPRSYVNIPLALALLGFGFAPALWPQAGTIASTPGGVVDEQGAVPPGPKIKPRSADNGSVYNAVANGEGIYPIPSIPIGSYTLKATATGFHTHVQSGIGLRVGDNVQINI